MIKRTTLTDFSIFILCSSAICFSCCLLFEPITYQAQGDFSAYLDLARQIYHLPGATAEDLSHRSPLYSLILGLFVIVFGESHYVIAMMVFQYVLICFSSLIIYKIILHLTGKSSVAFVAGLTGTLNLATIYFGFMMLSEILAMSLFMLTVWSLLKYYQEGKPAAVAFAGITAGLLILARYNMIGMPLVILVVITIVNIVEREQFKIVPVVRDVAIFVFAVVFIASSWAFRNYLSYARFELIPKHHLGQRWAVPATINPDNSVSEEYREVLAIFLRSREKLLKQKEHHVYMKSSLLEYRIIKNINDYYGPDVSGYLLYVESENELLDFYHLGKNPDGIRALNMKLGPFYQEIARQNRNQLIRLRIYSFLYSFKHISPALPIEEPINLNKLPSIVLKAYKGIMIMVIFLTFAGSLVHTIFLLTKKKRFKKGVLWIIMYGMIWYFPAVNTYANVLNDANRFRFPADMLIIGLSVALCYRFFDTISSPRTPTTRSSGRRG